MARDWGKKYEEVSKRITKKGRLAEEGHHLKQEADKKLVNESLQEKMIRTGVENFETGEVVDYNVACNDDNVWGFMNKSFYNKLVTDTKQQAKDEAEMELMNQFKTVLNEVLDARESDKRKMDLAMAQETTRQMELKIRELEVQAEILRLQVAANSKPVEFNLEPFMPTNNLEGKLTESLDDYSRAVDTINKAMNTTVEDLAEIKPNIASISAAEGLIKEGLIDGPVITKRSGSGKVVKEDNASVIPAQYVRESGRINWKAIEADDMFLAVIGNIVMDAASKDVNVFRGDIFRKSSNLAGAAYQRFMDANKGTRGAWEEFLLQLGLTK